QDESRCGYAAESLLLRARIHPRDAEPTRLSWPWCRPEPCMRGTPRGGVRSPIRAPVASLRRDTPRAIPADPCSSCFPASLGPYPLLEIAREPIPQQSAPAVQAPLDGPDRKLERLSGLRIG